jgi:putative transposase
MCKKYGKTFVTTTEEYTSKTRSWDGVIHPRLGSAKKISDGFVTVDRDHNGARGIFLKTLTRLLTPESDPECYIQKVLK